MIEAALVALAIVLWMVCLAVHTGEHFAKTTAGRRLSAWYYRWLTRPFERAWSWAVDSIANLGSWASAWWEDHHCIICGKFLRDGMAGYHWSCMRPLL